MFHKEITKKLPKHLFSGENNELGVSAVHFTNKIVIQLRFNGELDTTYEIIPKGLPIGDTLATPLAGDVLIEEEEEEGPEYPEDSDNEHMHHTSVQDNLSNFQTVTRLGDSNDMKLPIVCTQIAELYQKVIFPSDKDGMLAISPSRNFIITLSAKLWRQNKPDDDFGRLIFILQTIKEMYDL